MLHGCQHKCTTTLYFYGLDVPGVGISVFNLKFDDRRVGGLNLGFNCPHVGSVLCQDTALKLLPMGLVVPSMIVIAV